VLEVVVAEHDDIAFVRLAQRYINGAITALEVREVYLVHIDNWFDFKWLGWRTKKREEHLRIPPFSPGRVQSEKHFVWDVQASNWISTAVRNPLYYWPSQGRWLPTPINRLAEQAAFIWYSGNTTTNKVASLMFYLSGLGCYAWYASFKKADHWAVAKEARITRRELESFAERGRQLEVVQA
jgi:hypothetical protein